MTAVGLTIGVIVDKLKTGVSSVTRAIDNGLKDLGKKIGSILPGLVGAIASFVFRTAGQVISFLILFVAAFLIEKITKKAAGLIIFPPR